MSQVEKSLQDFMKRQEETITALEALRTTVKNHGSLVIKENIMDEDFDQVSHVVGELNNFTKLEYHSNMQEVVDFVRNVFGEMQLREREMSEFLSGIPREEEENVKAVLKMIGYSGVSRMKDAKKNMNYETVQLLNVAGYITMNPVKWGEGTMETFQLSEKGKKKFKELFETTASASFKEDLQKKYGNVEKGYFLFDVENALQDKNYVVHKLNESNIDIEEDNYHYYLTPDMGDMSEQDYFEVLNKKNSMKSIGFVCVDDETLENKARKAVDKWAKKNSDKCKFLSIHFATLESLENQNKPFETISF